MAGPRPFIEAFAPATVSNLGPGFDCLGLALSGLGDRVRARLGERPGVHVLSISGDGGRLPRDPERNTAAVAAREVLRRAGVDVGIELELEKGLPLGSGLGSSGASAAAAAVAVDAVIDAGLSSVALVDACRVAEAVACGAPHADNVAPAIVGGIVLVSALDPLRLVSLPVPPELWLCVYTPGCEVPTATARAVLPAMVSVADAVQQAARLGQLVHALHTGDLELLGEAIVDVIAEPPRAALVPGYLEAKTTCLEAGALACSMSGAGPTVFCLSRDSGRAAAFVDLLDEVFTHAGVPGRGSVERVGQGARLIGPALH